jgi:hypothetical protein
VYETVITDDGPEERVAVYGTYETQAALAALQQPGPWQHAAELAERWRKKAGEFAAMAYRYHQQERHVAGSEAGGWADGYRKCADQLSAALSAAGGEPKPDNVCAAEWLANVVRHCARREPEGACGGCPAFVSDDADRLCDGSVAELLAAAGAGPEAGPHEEATVDDSVREGREPVDERPLSEELYEWAWELLGEGDERRAEVANGLRDRAAALEQRLAEAEQQRDAATDSGLEAGAGEPMDSDIVLTMPTGPTIRYVGVAPEELERLRVNAARYRALEERAEYCYNEQCWGFDVPRQEAGDFAAFADALRAPATGGEATP